MSLNVGLACFCLHGRNFAAEMFFTSMADILYIQVTEIPFSPKGRNSHKVRTKFNSILTFLLHNHMLQKEIWLTIWANMTIILKTVPFWNILLFLGDTGTMEIVAIFWIFPDLTLRKSPKTMHHDTTTFK